MAEKTTRRKFQVAIFRNSAQSSRSILIYTVCEWARAMTGVSKFVFSVTCGPNLDLKFCTLIKHEINAILRQQIFFRFFMSKSTASPLNYIWMRTFLDLIKACVRGREFCRVRYLGFLFSFFYWWY